MLHIVGWKIQFWNRHGAKIKYTPTDEITDSFKHLLHKPYTLFDGGLRHNRVDGIKINIVLWDALLWKGELLTIKPFWYRRNILEDAIQPNESVSIPFQHKNSFGKIFGRVAKNAEIEGIVIKNLKGILNLSTKDNLESQWMFKVRRPSGRYRF